MESLSWADLVTLLGVLGSGGFLGALWQRRNQAALFRLQAEEAMRVRAEEREEARRIRAEDATRARHERSIDERRRLYADVMETASLIEDSARHALVMKMKAADVRRESPDDNERMGKARAEAEEANRSLIELAGKWEHLNRVTYLIAPDFVFDAFKPYSSALMKVQIESIASGTRSITEATRTAFDDAGKKFWLMARSDVGPDAQSYVEIVAELDRNTTELKKREEAFQNSVRKYEELKALHMAQRPWQIRWWLDRMPGR